MRRGGFVPQNFVIPPLHDNTSFMRLCIEGMSVVALGYRLETRRSFRVKTAKVSDIRSSRRRACSTQNGRSLGRGARRRDSAFDKL